MSPKAFSTVALLLTDNLRAFQHFVGITLAFGLYVQLVIQFYHVLVPDVDPDVAKAVV